MRGDVAALNNFFESAPAVKGGSIAQEQLRQSKNIFIVTATLVSRAAIRGGIDVTSSLALSDQYIQRCELASDIEGITDSDIHYFSLLRPFTEAQIAAIFATKGRDYYRVFRSCNRGSKKGIWCCSCPKCLFVYIIMSPFIDEDELVQIFGEKLLDKESLDKDFRELVGLDENKPFECVGTRSEVAACLQAYIESGKKSLLTDRYEQEIAKLRTQPLSEMMKEWCDDNCVPEVFVPRLKEALAEL